MRLQLDVRTSVSEIPWREVLRPGRSVSYGWLASAAPELGNRLHEAGWGAYGMVPIGHGAPVFPNATCRRGAYAAGGSGVVEFGSPLPEVVEAWAEALGKERVIDWGGVALRVTEVEPMEPPDFSRGYGLFRTVTPVVMKGSGRNEDGVRTTRQAWLLPREPEFPVYLAQNLRRKAETVGCDPDVTLERITWVGPKRSFAVGEGKKVGAAVEAELRGAPRTLQALWSWGLGQSNAAGFGWVTA